jgi:hypothetical protein
MTDTRITKIVSGVYRIGGLSVFRNQSEWLVTGRGREDEAYPTFGRAKLVALIIAGLATDAEFEEFRSYPQEG